ncbi:MAG: TDP-N-acetylfucosamine:lipid II N-acetylfucosaminyltransferase [Sulfurimonas sp.]|nr:TDP-N-acetylfucosamine:lipid II N-acetylfucosaminyltransferase [Sulfurimonas sp.]
MKNKILHVMIVDKFLAPFIDFVDTHVGRENHHYVFITSPKYLYGLTPEHNVEFLHTNDDIFMTLLAYMQEAEKIILHGLWREKVDMLLYFNPELLKKCYWFIWGGDFYFPEKQNWFKKQIIKDIAYLITDNQGDYELLKSMYGAKGMNIPCFGYPSNLHKELQSTPKKDKTLFIQLGNSADPTNQHIEALQILQVYKEEDIKIFVPLTYGNKEYAQGVIEEGYRLFGEKFFPIVEHMPYEEYMRFLEKIDIAIFNHNRQQAMGNIVTLLGMGKKVYLNKTTIWDYFAQDEIKVFSLADFDLHLLEQDEKEHNIDIIKARYSSEKLQKCLNTIFLKQAE